MSLQAAGAYLKRLREAAGISKLELSKRVRTSDSQIIRIEQGRETRASLLARIVAELNADPTDVIDLLVSDEYNASDGQARAEKWIEKRTETKKKKGVHPDIEQLAGQMTDYELGRWVALGERIIEERSKH